MSGFMRFLTKRMCPANASALSPGTWVRGCFKDRIPQNYPSNSCWRSLELKGVCMSLEQFAWLGAAMSGVGVMLGFVYFSIEIRHNTRAVRASAFQQAVNSFAEVSFELTKDKRLVELFIRAAKDYASLDEIERTQYTYMII